MAKVRKVPYYTMEPSLLRGKVWKEHYGSQGAVPINTPQKISYERPAPGTLPVPKTKPPKLTPEQIKQQQLDEARQKALAEQAKKLQQKSATQQPQPQPKPKVVEAEDREKIPEFDLQDIPTAMDKTGWPISAKIARRWFAGPSHVYNDEPNSVQPIDSTTVTLNWALKYGNTKKRLDELLGEKIYSANALKGIKQKVLQRLNAVFQASTSTSPPLSFDTTQYLGDLRQFHIDWQFQFNEVSTFDTLDGLLMTDLTGTLGNFNLYAAIGIVQVSGEKYFKYDKKPNEFCYDPVVEITHVYVYLKDNYSFNDKKGASKSQYLGHWNKTGMILSYTAAASDLVKSDMVKMGQDKIVQEKFNWDYMIKNKEVDKPVDTRTGIFRKLVSKEVYFPVYNSSYNEWREKHKKGEDFMIYSKPQLYKLKKTISFKLETLCRPYEATSTAH